ncbi:glycosyltransferase [Photobacterium leiognathi]|uniref:Glycosyl transferase n=1 Tax=Photobacterium leiognathi TaxID=553611 RepID=A0ABX5GBM0_PHOLE|nr:glycosyltransferase [Photobacterium leiognathi]KJF90575.1 glycosyl transferase [Photobacterium leiognathi]PSV78647.1 glycosyl transferase [Photobacterium leiognathi]
MLNRICILLAVYNGSDYLKEQIDSILNQENVEVDIYISLDLSSDTSLDIINDYVQVNNNIFLLDYGLSFGSAGQNFFRLLLDVDFSKYKYISFSDQDDIWLSNKLEHAIKILEKTNSDGYSSNVTAFWESGKQKLIKKDYPQKEFDYIFESSGPGCTFLMTESLTNRIKLSLEEQKAHLDKIWLHDWYCYAFARSQGIKWFIDSEPLMLYRQHESNQVGANKGLSQILSRLKIIISGDAFKKVLDQAEFIGIDNEPIKLIKKRNFFNLLKLSFMAFKCRRKPSDKVAFFIILVLMSFKSLL